MIQLLKAYRYYRKNHSFLWEKFISHTLVGDGEGFELLYQHIQDKFNVDKDEFIKLVAISYDRRVSRTLT